MKNIKLNDLIIKGGFYPGLEVGITKYEVEKVLGKSFKDADIETPDVTHYYVKLKSGLILSVIFDDEDICFEIKINLKENTDLNLVIQLGKHLERIKESTPFEKLISIISKLNIEWGFDRKRVYMQTVCIKLENGLRLYYALGKKIENDYGLFSISSILETHKYHDIGHERENR